MRRGWVAFIILTLIGAGLAGCGLFRLEQREPWRLQAEEECLARKQVREGAAIVRAHEIDGPGTCGISYPFKVSAFNDGSVALTHRATLACPIIPKIDEWIETIVQPAAELYFRSPVVEAKTGSYSCRSRNNQHGARLSEHAFGNAVDVMAFRLSNGREIKVVSGWQGAPEEQDFLREVFVGACRSFHTVLGPGADVFHHDHLHLDLARHDPQGRRRVCKPLIKFTPRLGEEGARIAEPRALPRPVPTLSSSLADDAGEGETDSAADAAVSMPVVPVVRPVQPGFQSGFDRIGSGQALY